MEVLAFAEQRVAEEEHSCDCCEKASLPETWPGERTTVVFREHPEGMSLSNSVAVVAVDKRGPPGLVLAAAPKLPFSSRRAALDPKKQPLLPFLSAYCH
jgi:hypothetical protein